MLMLILVSAVTPLGDYEWDQSSLVEGGEHGTDGRASNRRGDEHGYYGKLWPSHDSGEC